MLKLLRINSIRGRMVVAFLFFTFLLVLLALVSMHIANRASQVARIHSDINRLEIQTLTLINNDNDFFDLELINEDYFIHHNSQYLRKRDSLNRLISQNLADLVKTACHTQPEACSYLMQIDTTLTHYNQGFERLEALAFQKGFRDFGVEGAMRTHAHILEEESNATWMTEILLLRRHEKDFLLRSDTHYVQLYNQRYEALWEKLQPRWGGSYFAHHLEQYRDRFLELVQIQQELGLSSKHGLRSLLNGRTDHLVKLYLALSDFSYQRAVKANQEARWFYLAMLACAVVFSVISGYWFSRKLSEPISRLSRIMNTAIASRTTMKTDFSMSNAAHEIAQLTTTFNQLINQTNQHLGQIRQKSKLLRSKNRELKKLNRELDNFIYSTAHDLRSPLASLLGLIHIMRKENQQPGMGDYFVMMEKSIHRLEGFIAQIVSYSKNKRMELTLEPIHFRQLLADLLENHQFMEGFDRMRVYFTIQEERVFFSDLNRLTILLTNLISNAIKYADFGKPQPELTIEVIVGEREAVIRFADNGIGIEPQHLDKIFNMFYRANHYSKGSGLGLFILKETLHRMNGKIEVQSRPGVGTSFTLHLPNMAPAASTHEMQLAMAKMPA